VSTGPVEYIVVAFPENNFTGKIAPELGKLIESGLIRVLDLVFIAKDVDGSVATLEFDQLDEVAEFADLDGEVGGLISPEDLEHAASMLEPNSAAALLVWEDVWAAPFVGAVREAGGVLIEGGRIPQELIEAALDVLPQAT
jgi:Family of unknown function (DUF6325)